MNKHFEGWVLAGQSNMEGYGLLDDPGLDVEIDPRVISLGSDGEWRLAEEPLHWLWESYTPVHASINKSFMADESEKQLSTIEHASRHREVRVNGAGLGLAFGKERTDAIGSNVALIPCAHGGTEIELWMPGFSGLPADSLETLYGSMIDRIKRAKQLSGFELKGVLWYQGESDADTCQSDSYAQKLTHFIESVRKDVGDPDLLFVIIQLGKFITSNDPARRTHWNSLRETQRIIANQTSNTGLVTTLDLSICDEIHLDTQSLYRLGRRISSAVKRDFATPKISRVFYAGRTSNGYSSVKIEVENVHLGWRPGSLSGFEIVQLEGESTAGYRIYDARRDSADHKKIELIIGPTGVDFSSDLKLMYGQGFAPNCNALDMDDQGLPAFGPIDIEFEN